MLSGGSGSGLLGAVDGALASRENDLARNALSRPLHASQLVSQIAERRATYRSHIADLDRAEQLIASMEHDGLPELLELLRDKLCMV